MRWSLPLLVGCSAASGDPCEAGPDPVLRIGAGYDAYEAVDDGAALELIHGPQGGFHLEIGLAAERIDPEDRLLAHLTGTVDGEVLAETSPYLTFRCDPSAGELRAWGALLIYDGRPETLHDRTTAVSATLELADGDTVEADATFLIDDPELR